jgi:hypothetical protein
VTALAGSRAGNGRSRGGVTRTECAEPRRARLSIGSNIAQDRYAVSKRDETINPDLERFLAKRMNASTVELEARHLSLVSHAKQVADLILTAAGRQD